MPMGVEKIVLSHEKGDVWLQLQTDPIDAAAAIAFLSVPEAGGIDVFLGTTRRWTEGVETTELAYECYAEMAVKEMERLASDAARRWPVKRVCLIHRLGVVPPAEASVLIGVATPHRAAAFEATRFLIDQLKERVPIWKKEGYANGAAEWVERVFPASGGKRPEKERPT